MTIRPLGDRVVVCAAEVEETTKTGIILPGTAKEKPQVAEVIAVGPGGVVDGKEVVMSVKVGDRVIVSKYAGTDLSIATFPQPKTQATSLSFPKLLQRPKAKARL